MVDIVKRRSENQINEYPLRMQKVNDTVVNKLAVKDFMFKRRKFWYKRKLIIIIFMNFFKLSWAFI